MNNTDENKLDNVSQPPKNKKIRKTPDDSNESELKNPNKKKKLSTASWQPPTSAPLTWTIETGDSFFSTISNIDFQLDKKLNASTDISSAAQMQFLKIENWLNKNNINELKGLYSQASQRNIDLPILRQALRGQNTDGMSLLMIAVNTNNASVLTAIIELFQAVHPNDESALKSWINLVDNKRESALYKAINSKQAKKLTPKLLRAGANPNELFQVEKNHKTPLVNILAHRANTEMLKIFSYYGANLNCADYLLETPLLAALHPPETDSTTTEYKPLSEERRKAALFLLNTEKIDIDLIIGDEDDDEEAADDEEPRISALTYAIQYNAGAEIVKEIIRLKKYPPILQEWETAVFYAQAFPKAEVYLKLLGERYGTCPISKVNSEEAKLAQAEFQQYQNFCNFHHYYHVTDSLLSLTAQTEQKTTVMPSKQEKASEVMPSLAMFELKPIPGKGNCSFESFGITRKYFSEYLNFYLQSWEHQTEHQNEFKQLRLIIRNDILTMLETDFAQIQFSQIVQIANKKNYYAKFHASCDSKIKESPYNALIEAFLDGRNRFLSNLPTNEENSLQQFDKECMHLDVLVAHINAYSIDLGKDKLWPSIDLLQQFAYMRQRFADTSGNYARYVIWQEDDSKSRKISLRYPTKGDYQKLLSEKKSMQNIVFRPSKAHFDQLLPDAPSPNALYALCIEAYLNDCPQPMETFFTNKSIAYSTLQFIFNLYTNAPRYVKERDHILEGFLEHSRLTVGEIEQSSQFTSSQIAVLKDVLKSMQTQNNDNSHVNEDDIDNENDEGDKEEQANLQKAMQLSLNPSMSLAEEEDSQIISESKPALEKEEKKLISNELETYTNSSLISLKSKQLFFQANNSNPKPTDDGVHSLSLVTASTGSTSVASSSPTSSRLFTISQTPITSSSDASTSSTTVTASVNESIRDFH